MRLLVSCTRSIHSALLLAIVLRVVLFFWGLHQDQRGGDVAYTDVDYLVFTDASRCLLNPDSQFCYNATGPFAPSWLGDPFARSTYRYTPLLAVITAPSVFLHPASSKILFAASDLVIGRLIHDTLLLDGFDTSSAAQWACLWLLNPIVAVVSTRGNAESLIGLMVVYSLRQLKRRKLVSSAATLALAIHFKLYPIIYGASILASLGFRPKRGHVVYVFCTVVVLASLTAASYALWGHPFLEHSLLYHLKRTDHRHNFSPFYYPFYLLADQTAHGVPVNRLFRLLPLLAFVPQLLLCACFGLLFGKADLSFAWFIQTFIFVSYNKVCTSQYFLWYLWLAPLALPRLRMSKRRSLVLTCLWVGTQATWLSQAYLLEMEGKPVHHRVWLAGVAFFISNVAVIAQFAKYYNNHPVNYHAKVK